MRGGPPAERKVAQRSKKRPFWAFFDMGRWSVAADGVATGRRSMWQQTPLCDTHFVAPCYSMRVFLSAAATRSLQVGREVVPAAAFLRSGAEHGRPQTLRNACKLYARCSSEGGAAMARIEAMGRRWRRRRGDRSDRASGDRAAPRRHRRGEDSTLRRLTYDTTTERQRHYNDTMLST